MTDKPRPERDYTGVATWQLSEVFHRYNQNTMEQVSAHIPFGMHVRDLKKVVLTQAYAFTGLHVADRIFLAINKNISALAMSGEIIIIPANTKAAPVRMAQDEFWIKGIEPTQEELLYRASELEGLRDGMLARK